MPIHRAATGRVAYYLSPMLIVIFRAEIAEVDGEYERTAKELRKIAEQEYGCLDFVSSRQGQSEIALSYWPDAESIRAFRNDPRHLAAQERGKAHWYRSYRTEIAELR